MSLYKPVQQQVSNYCRALAGNEFDKRDLVQDTLLQAYEQFDKLKQHGLFKFYLCGIARNIYLNSRRRNKFWKDIEKSGAENLHCTMPEAEESLEVQQLYTALAKLKLEYRETLVMFEIMDFSLQEIQQHQGGSLSGVKMRLARARQQLTHILTGNLPAAKPQLQSNLI
jgi:RNA polymerase sigma-70 factor (ECF subfamily)